MKLAIMQPYLFPYLGYFQLIDAVDKFVIYDDVAFIKQGWINRNQILLNGRSYLFTVPLAGASSSRTISEIKINAAEYSRWKEKFLKTVELSYRKAPHYESTLSMLQQVLPVEPAGIGDMAYRSIAAVCDVLKLRAEIVPTSSIYGNAQLRSQERVLDICRKENVRTYVNATGGRELYSHSDFTARGMDLRFLRSRLPAYPQFQHEFVPALSILDVLMFNAPESIRAMMNEFDLES